jgi:uncharacterized membrane protein HdeD (DUF308 family)
MLKSRSTWLILIGVLAIIVGILALAWPRVTILALVTLFAIFAFIGVGQQASRSYRSATAGPVFGHLLLALIDLAAGVVALAWPGPTALVLVLVVAIWALVAGFTEIFTAFGRWETAGTRAMFIVTGLISIAFGVLLFAWPGLGAVTLALLFGIFAIVYGVSHIVTGIRLHRTTWARHSVLHDAPPEPGRA